MFWPPKLVTTSLSVQGKIKNQFLDDLPTYLSFLTDPKLLRRGKETVLQPKAKMRKICTYLSQPSKKNPSLSYPISDNYV